MDIDPDKFRRVKAEAESFYRNGLRFRVVAKQIENGSTFFWSFMPFWKTPRQETSGSKNKKLLHAGDLEED